MNDKLEIVKNKYTESHIEKDTKVVADFFVVESKARCMLSKL